MIIRSVEIEKFRAFENASFTLESVLLQFQDEMRHKRLRC